MKQYVGLVIIVKELRFSELIIISSLLIGKQGWRNRDRRDQAAHFFLGGLGPHFFISNFA